ncbi:Pr6Pr family membrane protein [soil metagenome]
MILGALRLAVAAGLVISITLQVADRAINNAFDPWEYFSYFTMQSSLITVALLAVGGFMALRLPQDTVLYTTLRMSALTYALVTAGMYNVLLRFVPYAGDYVGLTWPNEVMHVWVPLFLLLDWLFAPGRPALPWTALRIVPIFPVAWLIYTLMRGAASGGEIYPYPFIDPATAGWGSVIAYIVGLTGFLVGLGALAIAYSRGRARRALRANPAVG